MASQTDATLMRRCGDRQVMVAIVLNVGISLLDLIARDVRICTSGELRMRDVSPVIVTPLVSVKCHDAIHSFRNLIYLLYLHDYAVFHDCLIAH